MFSIRTTQPKRDTHVAPLGLGGLGVPTFYKHVAPLVLFIPRTVEHKDYTDNTGNARKTPQRRGEHREDEKTG